jgi:1-acyl-sn-glycerol-3-phosphate acyltransferase
LFPIDLKTWPARFRRSALLEAATRFFSFRVIVERAVDPKVPVILAVGPGTSLPVGSLLLCMASEFFLGFNIHLLLRRSILSFPLAGTLFRLLGCVEDSPQALRNALKSKRSVCVGFSSVSGTNEDSILLPRNKDFVYAALELGAQIIPCYCFGTSQATSAKPFPGTLAQFSSRVPLLFVIGRPVACPQVDKPSPELVNEFHESFLREERRIFEAYKNTFAPAELRLTLKR